ncbi:MAG: LPS export ABC transporter permease LptF [Alphaproteobacteria bacterium]
MLKITSYILRQLTFTTLFVTFVLTGAVWLTQSLRFVDGIINKGLPASTFFYLIIFLLPDLVSIVLPGAVLVSLMFVYNRLIADNELIVMRSSGLSNWQLAKAPLALGLFLTAGLFAMHMFVLPKSYSSMRDMQHQIRNTVTAGMLQEGEFTTISGRTVYVRKRNGLKEISGILIHDRSDPTKPFSITAAEGSILENEKGEVQIVLFDGARHERSARTGTPSVLYFDQYTVDLGDIAVSTTGRFRKPHEYTIDELFAPPDPNLTLQQQRKLRSEAHSRLLSPLYVLAFTLIGLAIILFGDINRRRRTKRMGAIAVLACCLQASIMGLLNLSERVIVALPVAYTIMLLAIILPVTVMSGTMMKFFRRVS